MVYKLVGLEDVDYTSKKTNEQVQGVKLHVLGAKDSNSRVKGCAVDTLWIGKRSDMYDDIIKIPVDTNIECFYNRWGNVDSIRVMK